MNRASNPDDTGERRLSQSEFLRSFVRDYRTVGAIRETSRGVATRIADLARVRNASRIAELGCGTGPITRVVLEQMPSHATLWGFEIHPPFVEYMGSAVDDPRFRLFESSAVDLPKLREQDGSPPFDAIISTIPFSYLARPLTMKILRGVVESLADEGRFVALQYHPTYLRPLLRHAFDNVERELYLWNVPPATLLTASQPRRL